MENDICIKILDSFWRAYKADFANAIRESSVQSNSRVSSSRVDDLQDGSDLNNNVSAVCIQDS